MILGVTTVAADWILFEKCQATSYCIFSFNYMIKYTFVQHLHMLKCVHILFVKILNSPKCFYVGSKKPLLTRVTIGPLLLSVSHNMYWGCRSFLLSEKLYYNEHFVTATQITRRGILCSKHSKNSQEFTIVGIKFFFLP